MTLPLLNRIEYASEACMMLYQKRSVVCRNGKEIQKVDGRVFKIFQWAKREKSGEI